MLHRKWLSILLTLCMMLSLMPVTAQADEGIYTVTLTANPSAGGKVTGAGTYSDGDDVTVSASANGGYRFDHWKRDDNTTIDDASFTFVIHENHTFEAVFVEDPTNVSSYTLVMPDSITITQNAATTAFTVNVSALDLRPNASGNTPESFRVQVNAATLVNQSDPEKTISFKLCPYDTTVGTSDTLYFKFTSAQSKPGYIVIADSQWNVATPGVYTGSMTYQPYFQYSNGDPEWLETVKRIPIALTIPESATSYTVTVNNGTGSGEYAEGASVTITADEPEEGKQFKEWTGVDGLTFTSGSATTSTATFTMPAGDVTVTATYEDIPVVSYTVTYKVVNGMWADGSTEEKTENVASGNKPASVPTGMIAGSGYAGGAWDTEPADATITGDTTFTYTFEAIPTYTVTYKVVNGTWADGSTADKTEIVASGSAPASIPTGMIASSGYTGGEWDTEPADATITRDTTFTYTFETAPVTTYTVTYKVVNGTWADGTTEDKTETVASGFSPASVPTGMIASSGYTGGEWDTDPDTTTITEDTTFTYSFEAVPVTTYTVTYKVVNGTWADGTTADKTEIVASGNKPASVPTGMIASSGYTDGAWDTEPTDATITEDTTFTYSFEAAPVTNYTVTYKVVNGTWADGSTADKTEIAASGSAPSSIPTGMIASSGYTGGEWDTEPADAMITGDTTFTYTFVAVPVTNYTVTYKVVNGIWADGTTEDKTETVASGNKLASVPTGMIASSGFTGGAWNTDPTTATITEDTTFTYSFEATPVTTYTVTYKVVGGTWSDGTTADKTETVASGNKPASVPTGMIASSGYTGGAWDTEPADATITGDTTFTYTFETVPVTTYTVTYKVVNGTWADGTTTDKTETVASGNKPASVPTGMIASSGFTGGAWNTDPTTATITGDTTFTYTFKAIPVTSYTVTEGAGGSWTKGSGASYTIIIKRSEDDANCFSHYTETLIDGKVVSVSAKAGSTIITISADTLEKLSTGSHTVTVKFDDGQVETKLTVKAVSSPDDPTTPQTGDNSHIGLWIILLCVSGSALICLLIASKKRKALR